MATSDCVIQAQQISKQVVSTDQQPLTILHALNLQVNKGDSLAIVGRSGSGKSTLLNMLAGLDLPSTGQLTLLGQSITELSEDQRAALRSGRVGFIFQSFMLLPSLTALENVMLPLQLEGQRQVREQALHWLAQVGLEQRAHHLPGQLSGGEQQRVAIARAFVSEPELIFADEPTGNLDTGTGERINELLFTTQQQKQSTLILVTHDDKLAQQCQRQLRLQAGKVEASCQV